MLARELVAERPDVLVTTGDPATKALQVATATVAIVTMSDDVIGAGSQQAWHVRAETPRG
jgi:ABC-type uncharacterized transport system substrate-binding protein